MTKAELIDRIARSRDLPPDMTKKCIGEILDVAFEELATYFTKSKITRTTTPRFTFPGFGTFTKKKRAPRRGVNPQTLEPMMIDGHFTLDFKPGAALRRTLNDATAVGSRRSKTRASTRATTRTKRVAKKKPARKAAASAASQNKKVASPSGRALISREEAEAEMVDLPEAPLQRARRRRSDKESTG